MGHASVSFDFYPEGEEGPTVELEARGEFSPYIPAKTSGPPDRCYPAEGGELEDMHVFRIFPNGKNSFGRMTYREEEVDPKVLYQLLVDDPDRPPKTLEEAEEYVDNELYQNVEEDEPDYPDYEPEYYEDY